MRVLLTEKISLRVNCLLVISRRCVGVTNVLSGSVLTLGFLKLFISNDLGIAKFTPMHSEN